MKQDIIKMSVKTLSRCLETKELSALEAADAYLEQIEKKEAEIGAFLTITKEAAWETAKQVDAKRMKNDPLLHWQGFQLESRTIFAQKVFQRPVLPGCWNILSPLMTPQSWNR